MADKKRRKRCQLCNELTHNDLRYIKNPHISHSYPMNLILCEGCRAKHVTRCPICYQRYWKGDEAQVKAVIERMRSR